MEILDFIIQVMMYELQCKFLSDDKSVTICKKKKKKKKSL